MFQLCTRVTEILKSYLHSFSVAIFCVRLFFVMTDVCRLCVFGLVTGHFQSIPDSFYVQYKQTKRNVLGN